MSMRSTLLVDGSRLPCIARWLPIHVLGPLPNDQNHRSLSSSRCVLILAPASSIHRSGCQRSGSGNMAGLRWRHHPNAVTRTLGGMSGKPPRLVGVERGVRRGWPAYPLGRSRKLSRMTARKKGRPSSSLALGSRSSVEGNLIGVASARTSCWTRRWAAGWRESSRKTYARAMPNHCQLC